MKFSKLLDNVNTELVMLPFEECHEYIQKHNWAPALFIDNYRKKSNYELSECIGIDIDEGLTTNNAILRLDKLDINYSLTMSKNHLVDKDGTINHRMRILLPLSAPLNSSVEYENAINAIRIKLFPELDPQTRDSSRYFFASSSKYNSKESRLVSNKKNINPKTDLQLTNVADLLLKGDIENPVIDFFKNPQKYVRENRWNEMMSRAALSLAARGTEHQEIITTIQGLAPQVLDNNDLAAIKCAYEKGAQSYDVQKSPPKEKFNRIYQSLEPHLSWIHIIETRCKVKTILFEEKNEVQYIDSKVLENIFIKEMATLNIFQSNNNSKEHMRYFVANKDASNKEPPLISFKNDKGLAFKKVDVEPTNGECPHFMDLVNRCSNKDALCAFIGSIFLMKSDLQQYLWIKGEGGDGKGAITRLLKKLLENVYASESSSGVRSDNHYTSNFLGKRLIVYPDNQYEKLTKEDVFKMITGGDPLKINPKYQQPFTKLLPLKVIVLSNCLPDISSQKSDLRRAIISEVSPFHHEPDPNYENKLWAERNYIINYCLEKYKDLTLRNGPIEVDKEIGKLIAKESELVFSQLFNQLFAKDNDATLTPEEFYSHLITECKIRRIKYKDFKTWALRNGYIEEERKNKSSRLIKGIKLKPVDPSHPPSFDKNFKSEVDISSY